MNALQHRICRPCQCTQCQPQPAVAVAHADPIRRVPHVWPQVIERDTAPTVMRPVWPKGGK